MRRKTIFSLLGLALCSLSSMAQTYKLTDMTETEFEAGSNAHFRFDQYRLASGTYSDFVAYTDSGRVNYFDRYWPERFQGDAIGMTIAGTAAEKEYYSPQYGSHAAKKVTLELGRDGNDPTSFLYAARIDENTYETYPTLKGAAAISFVAPAEGYYKITTQWVRQDQNANGAVNYLMAKFRFRQEGTTQVNPSMTLGQDVQYGLMTDAGETYEAPSGVNYDGAMRTYKKTDPVTQVFYVHIKEGDMVTAEADMSHLYGSDMFLDSTSYWARDVFGRTRWTQFEAAVVTKEEAESGTGNFVDPYDDAGNAEYIDKFKNLWADFGIELGEAEENEGFGEGQYNPSDVKAMWVLMNDYASSALDENLLGMVAKVLYEQLTAEIEEFRSKVNAIDWTEAGNYILFGVPTDAAYYYNNFVPQFEKQQESAWNFKSYTVDSGMYKDLENLGTDNKLGTNAWFDGAGDWFYLGQDGSIHPTTAKAPVVVFTAPEDGVYQAATTIQRDKGNKNNNYMYTRYRFAQGGIKDGETSISKESYLFADAYGHPSDNVAVNRIFYVNLKAGDALTFEEDCYTAGSNGSAGSQWGKITMMMIPAEEIEEIIKENPEAYADPYQQATDFEAMDSVLVAVKGTISAAQVDDEKIGAYPEAAKWELEDVLTLAEDLRESTSTTQYELNLAALTLEQAHATFLLRKNVRIEDGETFVSGAYYIEMDGLYLTTDTCWVSGTAISRHYAHFEPLINKELKNNQVFNVQFNADQTDPYRFTFTTCLKDNVWATDGEYHITEKGEIRDGNTETAQSSTISDNHIWRNHSLIYDGTNWCIYNVKNNVSIVFSDDLTAYPTTTSAKQYLYKLVEFGTVGVEGVETSDNDTRIHVISNEAGALTLNCNKEIGAEIRNVGGSLIQSVKLGSGEVKVSLASGLYFVITADGTVEKAIVL